MTQISYTALSPEADALVAGMFEEFNDLLDCVWKLNGHIRTIWKEETEKIAAESFPAAARMRFTEESRKAFGSFPTFLNYSFVTLAYSLLERNVREMTRIVQKQMNIPISEREMSGSPTQRTLLYLERFCGFDRTKLPNWKVIETLGVVRNCIAHTSGFLASFAEAKNLEQRIASKAYRRATITGSADLTIEGSGDSRRIWASRDYVHSAVADCRDFLLELAVASKVVTRSEA